MICLLGLIVFGILGIFSVSHRQIAKEAFDCVFRRITLRPCQTGFDQKMKTHIVSKLMGLPKLAKITYKYFELISWAFTISLIISLLLVGHGIYNYAVYGNCNGPHSQDFCIFAPFNSDISCGSNHCVENGCACGGDVLCTEENDYLPCEGNCECNSDVCGEKISQ